MVFPHETDDFGLDDDPARVAPRARRIVGTLHVEMLGLLAAPGRPPKDRAAMARAFVAKAVACRDARTSIAGSACRSNTALLAIATT